MAIPKAPVKRNARNIDQESLEPSASNRETSTSSTSTSDSFSSSSVISASSSSASSSSSAESEKRRKREKRREKKSARKEKRKTEKKSNSKEKQRNREARSAILKASLEDSSKIEKLLCHNWHKISSKEFKRLLVKTFRKRIERSDKIDTGTKDELIRQVKVLAEAHENSFSRYKRAARKVHRGQALSAKKTKRMMEKSLEIIATMASTASPRRKLNGILQDAEKAFYSIVQNDPECNATDDCAYFMTLDTLGKQTEEYYRSRPKSVGSRDNTKEKPGGGG